MRPWISIRPGVSDLISEAAPGWAEGGYICKPDLSKFRREYVENLLEDERGELNELDRQVINSIEQGQIVSRNPADEIEASETIGERTADKVAEFGGSWTFIISFSVVLILWITLNVVGLMARPFDPYPFILLNLVLSCLAAMQAPVIMMSQRRQETKDRLRAENDYRVNLKAELEIRQLHEKIDHQLAHQWEKLAKLQQIQIELLEETADGRR
jgi:Predicted membrane protein